MPDRAESGLPTKRLKSRDNADQSTAMYESEITKFIRELKTARPHLEEDQRKGRALLWDKKPLNMKELGEQDAAKVAQQPYPYATK
jgi:hypothetical protein